MPLLIVVLPVPFIFVWMRSRVLARMALNKEGYVPNLDEDLYDTVMRTPSLKEKAQGLVPLMHLRNKHQHRDIEELVRVDKRFRAEVRQKMWNDLATDPKLAVKKKDMKNDEFFQAMKNEEYEKKALICKYGKLHWAGHAQLVRRC